MQMLLMIRSVQDSNLYYHVHFCAQGHDLQRHRCHFANIWILNFVRKAEAVHLLAGVTVAIEDSAASLWSKTRISILKF